MGLYKAFRSTSGLTQYEEKHTAVTVDVFIVGLIFAFVAIGFSFCILLPGYMSKERYSVALRTFLSLFIGAGILFSNYGMEWEKSAVETDTQYKSFMSKEIKVKVGVKIGLRGVNVTLKGLPVEQKFDSDKTTEHVDYNERFVWNSPWSQGREGYGEHASHVNNEYHQALHRGIPYPILLIAEYFTVDGERIRWGRSFRIAGFYTQMMLWLAFTLWVITNILFLMVIRYGAYFLSLTGIIILLGNILYHVLHYGPSIVIPFPAGNLDFQYGWCFWLSLVTGLLCVFLGLLIIILDYFWPGAVANFFNIDIVTEFEDVVEEQEIFTGVSEGKLNRESSSDEDDLLETGEPSKRHVQFVATSRYAGISNWNPKKSPLSQTYSFPTTSKEINILDEDNSQPPGITRRRSISLSFQPQQNDGFRSSQYEMKEVHEENIEQLSEDDSKGFNSPC